MEKPGLRPAKKRGLRWLFDERLTALTLIDMGGALLPFSIFHQVMRSLRILQRVAIMTVRIAKESLLRYNDNNHFTVLAIGCTESLPCIEPADQRLMRCRQCQALFDSGFLGYHEDIFYG